MSDIYGAPTMWDKIIPVGCLLILLVFIACLPSMVADKNRRLEQQWQSNGCRMYDDTKMSEVPAKCQQFFVDHYTAQPARTQPPSGTN